MKTRTRSATPALERFLATLPVEDRARMRRWVEKLKADGVKTIQLRRKSDDEKPSRASSKPAR